MPGTETPWMNCEVAGQGTPKCIGNSAPLSSGWSVPTSHLHLGAALPAWALVGYSQPAPPALLGSTQGQPGTAWQESPLFSSCSLSCLAFYTSSSNSGARTNGKWKALACKCSDQTETCDLACSADCQGKHDCPDKRVYERMPAVIRLVRETAALWPSANSQYLEGNEVDCKKGHAMMQCNMQLDCFSIEVC